MLELFSESVRCAALTSMVPISMVNPFGAPPSWWVDLRGVYQFARICRDHFSRSFSQARRNVKSFEQSVYRLGSMILSFGIMGKFRIIQKRGGGVTVCQIIPDHQKALFRNLRLGYIERKSNSLRAEFKNWLQRQERFKPAWIAGSRMQKMESDRP